MDITKLSYEEAYEKLEKILEAMEKEKLSLEDSIEKFNLANNLYKHCENLLTKAEGRVKVIMEDGLEEDFSVEV